MSNKKKNNVSFQDNNSSRQPVLDNNSIDFKIEDANQLYKGLEQVSPLKSFINN